MREPDNWWVKVEEFICPYQYFKDKKMICYDPANKSYNQKTGIAECNYKNCPNKLTKRLNIMSGYYIKIDPKRRYWIAVTIWIGERSISFDFPTFKKFKEATP